MNTLRLKAAALAWVLLAPLAACAQTDPPPQPSATGNDTARERMIALREKGWRLLEKFGEQASGLPDPYEWTPSHRVLSRVVVDDEIVPAQPFERAHESLWARPARAKLLADDEEHVEPVYQMTFFNSIARSYIERHRLNVWETTLELKNQQVRDLQFPPGSAAAKTFWYLLRPGGSTATTENSVDVAKWAWDAATEDGKIDLDPNDLHSRCVSEKEHDGNCVFAEKSFYTIRVDDKTTFSCVRDDTCPSLENGDLLILVALHVAHKETPEWLWATFWWRDEDAPQGEFWTCGDAQREQALGDVSEPWSNYSMDVVASAILFKPVPQNNGDLKCGFPHPFKGDKDQQQRVAAYNPFIEAPSDNGLKSSCIDCHTRASTRATRLIEVPELETHGGPPLRDFEGHIRLDYMWSLSNALRTTTSPINSGP